MKAPQLRKGAGSTLQMQAKMEAGTFGSEDEGDLDPIVKETADILGRVFPRKDGTGIKKSRLQQDSSYGN